MRPEYAFGLRLYCLTVKCRVVLEDLEATAEALDFALREHRAALPVAAALGLLACTVLALAMLYPGWTGSTGRMRRAAVAFGVLLLTLTAFSNLHRAVDMQPMAPWLHSHSCIDHTRCAQGFRVYLDVGMGFNMTQALAQPVPPIWMPPPNVKLAPSPDDACLIIHPVSSNTDSLKNLPQLARPCACSADPYSCRPTGGQNHVIVARGDQGVSWRSRLRKLGCAMVAQSHMELSRFVAGFDISLPLGLVPGRNGAPGLHVLEAIAPRQLVKRPGTHPAPRAFWLTFRGAVNYNDRRERRALLVLLANRSTTKRPIVISCHCAKVNGRYIGSQLSAGTCDTLAAEQKKAPSYLRTLNTTFALVPGGMQPASFRLDEVMAAGAIPVFVAGDLDDSSPYVRPFADAIPWSKISLHFAWEHAGHIVDVLNRIPDSQIVQMQHGVQQAWQHFLRPPLAHRQTFYELLEERVAYQAR